MSTFLVELPSKSARCFPACWPSSNGGPVPVRSSTADDEDERSLPFPVPPLFLSRFSPQKHARAKGRGTKITRNHRKGKGRAFLKLCERERENSLHNSVLKYTFLAPPGLPGANSSHAVFSLDARTSQGPERGQTTEKAPCPRGLPSPRPQRAIASNWCC